MVSKESTARSGISKPKQNPFAEAAPIRSPVYEPGPLPKLIASRSLSCISAPSKAHSTKVCKLSDCL